MPDVILARNWSKTRVESALANQQRSELIHFVGERHSERFFEPIRHLAFVPSNEQGFGFAIMSLCCLLIETLESYRKGLPSTSQSEIKMMSEMPVNQTAISEYKLIPLKKSESQGAFEDFFKRAEVERFLPGVDGKDFFKNIRCGLLHQGQTKDGWRIVRAGKFWQSSPEKTINRNEFATRLKEYFDEFLKELDSQKEWDKDPWLSTRKKIFWLIQTS